MIRINGADGEGGGQILRTALSLSLATGAPFRIENIRAGRKNPGLLRQHLTAVEAAVRIGDAEVEGATLSSPALTFAPKTVRAGEYRFAVGTAGSGSLVFQTILPALLRAPGPSHVVIEGGTHNSAAPPFDFLQRTFLPLVRRMGAKVSLRLERYGFYPAGGGRFVAEIEPVAGLQPLELGLRGEILARRMTAIVANLPARIAMREIEVVSSMMRLTEEGRILQTRDSPGPGNAVLIEVESADVTEIFTAFGRRGAPAEKVAEEAVAEAREYLVSRAVAGEHLTDQLLLPLALAGGGSFTATKISRHAQTNQEVIAKFLPVQFDIRRAEDHSLVRVTPS
ncbi:MAG TPA: RNA 3'-terminal phosphate cyclase [Terriglobia bacterium]|nr:RNA 3'-terminal phosphate cyclase [Terriglobia bacterium]